MSEPALKIANSPRPLTPEEVKKHKFHKIAAARTNRALHKIGLLGNCANRSTYSYNESDVKKVFGRLRMALDVVEAKFTPSYRDQDEFSF